MFNQPDPDIGLKSIGTVIAKPTRACNADCDYCAAPPYDRERWNLDTFKRHFSKISPHLADRADWLWHGGEPMLYSPQFYRDAMAFVKEMRPDVTFSMQTNILKYTSEKWRDVFKEIFKGSISTSYDPDEKHRTINGSSEAYSKQFHRAMKAMLDDGFHMFIIGVFDDKNIKDAQKLYDLAKKYDGQVTIRVNYKIPVGRIRQDSENATHLLDPVIYGNELISLERQRKEDGSDVGIVPNDIMRSRMKGTLDNLCPWMANCGGTLISIEPNGDVYNCDNYAELNDRSQCFGNINTNSMYEILTSKALNQMKERPYSLPSSCYECDYFHACQGGCSRDAYLYTGDTNGKFPYCKTWKMVFEEVKS